MKKEKYVIPQAVEETFVPNSYAAKCGLSITKNEMRCINPYHNHYNGNPFASVWKSGDVGDVCDIIVTSSTPKSNSKGGMWVPPDDPCLFKDGHSENATEGVFVKGVGFYFVPSSVAKSEGGDCYGSYRFDGSALDKILS